jgi:hypothetical protein
MAIVHKGFALTVVVCAGLCGASVRSASLSLLDRHPSLHLGHTLRLIA